MYKKAGYEKKFTKLASYNMLLQEQNSLTTKTLVNLC